VVGYVAVFIALSGTAYAVDGPLPGVDQVGSEDIINGEVKAPELATNAIVDDNPQPITGSTKIGTGAIKQSELGGSSVFSGEVAPGALNGGSDIEDGSLQVPRSPTGRSAPPIWQRVQSERRRWRATRSRATT
jgi:hypothetical protein